jgi:hypothetical protein
MTCRIGVPLKSPPTAQASVLESAVTPLRKPEGVLSVGLGTMLQALPFQCSINIRVCKKNN